MPFRSEPVSRRNRPAKPPLTRQGIVEIALRVLRDEGLERATMRRLATELDTGPASLYVYVHNTAELHTAVLDQLLGDLDLGVGPAATDWTDRLTDLLVAYTRLLFTYPSLARSVLALRPSGPNYLRLVDSILALLRSGDVPDRQAAWGVDQLLLTATAIGAEQGTREESVDAHEEQHDPAAGFFADLRTEEYPHISAVASHLFSGSHEQRIRWTFHAIIAGVAATATPSPPSATPSPSAEALRSAATQPPSPASPSNS